jgi:hypothetical protein
MLMLHRNCAYSRKDKITRNLLGITNLIFGTKAVHTSCCHIQCCFSLPVIHLTDQGFDDQCPDSEECHFGCNLVGSSMARLLDILINSYGRMSSNSRTPLIRTLVNRIGLALGRFVENSKN